MKPYLIAYNGIQAAGWISILFQTIHHFWQEGNLASLFKSVEFTLKIAQTAALLEVLHCLVGIVSSSWLLTLVQVMSRVVVLWPVTAFASKPQSSVGFALYLACWTITESIRYSFYLFQLLHSCPTFLLWLRYSSFILLYPIGVTGELLAIVSCFLEVRSTGQFSFSMPNIINFEFSYPFALVALMLLYIPCFPPLYLHMFAQRAKVLRTIKHKRQ